MSSAINHIKRSHRSAYHARAFSGRGRQSVIKPTLHKQSFGDMIRRIWHNRKAPRQPDKAEETA